MPSLSPPAPTADVSPVSDVPAPRAAAIMIQGTGSDVGKSLFVAGLCRAFTRRGLTVRPFKPQNMSNNAAVTTDGGEIGRAQALQARACRAEPSVHMNPVLLKPQSDTGSQVVLCGQVLGNATARDYHALKPTLLPRVLDSFRQLRQGCDLVVVEGAGSAAEVNLRPADIANMGFAEAAGLPVLLLGDIDRGGVLAQLVGTHALLPDSERNRIRGFLVNKFRGDPALFADGLQLVSERTGWPALGLVPWFAAASLLPAEDGMSLGNRRTLTSGQPEFVPPVKSVPPVKIAIPRLSRLANFDDFDPLAQEPGVEVVFVAAGSPLPGDADLILLPGSKSTRADLDFFRANGWDIDLAAHLRRGGRVAGICAGFQMLGTVVRDPLGLEGEAGDSPGLGLLEMTTTITRDKVLLALEDSDRRSGCAISGYEMHMGRSEGPALTRPWLFLEQAGRPEGAVSASGQVMGCYIHGLFGSDGFRRHFLRLSGSTSPLSYRQQLEETLDRLADHLEAHTDLDHILDLSRQTIP